MAAVAAISSGRYSGRQPASTALIAMRSTVAAPNAGGMVAISSSGARRVWRSMAATATASSVGGRAGIFIPAGQNVHIGVGAAYEVYLDCDTSTYSSCTDAYPELSVVASF